MSWYYHQTYGEVVEETGWRKWLQDREIDQEKIAAAAGVPQTWFGPFATQAQAQAFGSTHPSLTDQAKAAVQAPIQDLTGAVTAAVNTAVKLWVRVAEAAVGIVLLAIAANAIVKQTTGVDAAGAAARAGKTAGKGAAAAAVL